MNSEMKTFIKRVFWFLKPHINSEIAGFFLTILYSLAVFASLMISRYMIDTIVPSNSKNLLYKGLMIFFIICMAQPIIGIMKDILFLNISEKVSFEIRKKLFSKVVNTDLTFFERVTKGSILSRIVNDGNRASQIITNLFISFIKNAFMVVIIIVGMIMISIKLTIFVLLLFGLFVILNLKVGNHFKKIARQQREKYDDLCTAVNQMSDSIITIKSFNLEKKIIQRFDEEISDLYKINKKLKIMGSAIGNLSSVVVVTSLCIIYGLGILDVMDGEMTLGAVIALGLYYQMLIGPLNQLINNNIQINTSIPVFDRIFEYFNLEKENREEVFKTEISEEIEYKKLIEIDGLNFAYGKDEYVLKDINLEFPNRGLVAIIGESGTGKSTLVKLIMKLYKPNSGKIKFRGRNIQDIKTSMLRADISYVPQESDFLNSSIKANLKSGNQYVLDEEIHRVCKKLGLHKKIMSLNKGYDSIISERENFSGGEKQRLSIARAVIKESEVLILDEPTSALDYESEKAIINCMEELAKERLLIVIAHRTSTIKNADRIIELKEGKIKRIEIK